MQVASVKGAAGVYTSLFHYHRMWRELGIQSVCLYRGPKTDQLKRSGISLVQAPSSITKRYFALTPSRLAVRRNVLAKLGAPPDVVMVHSDLAIGAIKSMFPEAIILTRCHSDKTKHKAAADVVVTLNPDQHERVVEALRYAPSHVVLAGHPFMPETTIGPVTGDGQPRVNLVARFVPEKNPGTFVNAVLALENDTNFRVRIIGDGPLKQNIKDALADSKLDTEFTGWLHNPLESFTKQDVLVLPSLWEGLPWLLLEAQARGIMSIASNIAGNSFALDDGQCGDLFPAGDHIALASAIAAALRDPSNLRAKAIRGYETIQDRFGARAFWSKIQDTTITSNSNLPSS